MRLRVCIRSKATKKLPAAIAYAWEASTIILAGESSAVQWGRAGARERRLLHQRRACKKADVVIKAGGEVLESDHMHQNLGRAIIWALHQKRDEDEIRLCCGASRSYRP
jgi:hypothetical protein